MKLLIYSSLLSLLLTTGIAQTNQWTIKSPDKKISVQVSLAGGMAKYTINYNNTLLLQDSKLGVVMEDDDFTKGLKLSSSGKVTTVTDDFEMAHGKRRQCHYKANEQVFHFTNAANHKMDIIFRLSDDGAAFRYYFPDNAATVKKIISEITSFHFTKDTKAFLQPMSDAKTGWSDVNPAYEEHYQKSIDAGTPSPFAGGWVYPALFSSGQNWVLITEASLDKNYCATRLAQHSPDREYTVGFPQAAESFPGGPVNPQSSLPWYTPWRVLTIGSLKTIIESDLGTALAAPAVAMDKSFIKPGHSSWSWVLLKDDSTVYDVQKRFIDYAADMHWEYCLIDADWDKKIGYEKAKELATYAKTKNIGIVLWYNSSGDWNKTVYSPKSKLLTHEDREKEFSLLQSMGIAGLKVDFFGGDGQSVIKYYIDLLEDAAKYKFLMNFHGATLPRGWHRTYPNLMSMEAIKGFEFVTFDQRNADEQPVHCTILPFTRNAFDPMDFTPMCLYEIPRIQRRTTSSFELALSVTFLSGIQHFAETPQGMKHVPDYVKEFLRELPVQWDDTKFISGFPGKDVVLARKSNDTWYISGINGENISKKITIDLSVLGKNTRKGYMITDGTEPLSFTKTAIPGVQQKMDVELKGNGGFVMVVK